MTWPSDRSSEREAVTDECDIMGDALRRGMGGRFEAFLQKQVAAKSELIQISTAYGQQKEAGKIITRSKYVEIESEKPDTPEQAKWAEFKTCKYITEAIVSEGIDKGQLRKTCADADCPIHHPMKQNAEADVSFKAERSGEECLDGTNAAIEWRRVGTSIRTAARLLRAQDRTWSGQSLPLG